MKFTRRPYGLTLTERLSYALERFWLCRVRGQHREKMDTYGRCYRCGKAMR